jgi:hypothetical protein
MVTQVVGFLTVCTDCRELTFKYTTIWLFHTIWKKLFTIQPATKCYITHALVKALLNTLRFINNDNKQHNNKLQLIPITYLSKSLTDPAMIPPHFPAAHLITRYVYIYNFMSTVTLPKSSVTNQHTAFDYVILQTTFNTSTELHLNILSVCWIFSLETNKMLFYTIFLQCWPFINVAPIKFESLRVSGNTGGKSYDNFNFYSIWDLSLRTRPITAHRFNCVIYANFHVEQWDDIWLMKETEFRIM